ncbi:hypothetical protein [Anaerococcus hydrogenalis]|nr:hypothetical protein [Anaerococcus hydrogenalis]
MKKTLTKILFAVLGLCVLGAIAFFAFGQKGGKSILKKSDGKIDTSKADIKVEISGFDGYGKAKLSKNEIENLDIESFNDDYSTDDILDSIDIDLKANKLENLSNGDEIEITINFKNTSDLDIDITNKKVVKKIKVKGLEKIINSLDDLDDDTLDRMNKDARKKLGKDFYDRNKGSDDDKYHTGDKMNYEFNQLAILEKPLTKEEIIEKSKFDNQKSYAIAMVYEIKFQEVKDYKYDDDTNKKVITKKEDKVKYAVFTFENIQKNNGGIIYSTNRPYLVDSEEKALNQIKYDGYELIDNDENKKTDLSNQSNNEKEENNKKDDNK